MADFLHRIIQERTAESFVVSHNNLEERNNQRSPFVRLAIYDSATAAPRVVDLAADGRSELINLLTTKTYQFAHEKGGAIPFTVIREIIENLLHADFREVIITVLDNGNTIRVSDQGPGIADKEKALLPGFSTADFEMKGFIKGVGSGLPVASESLSFLGGHLSVAGNLNCGTVITLRVDSKTPSSPEESAAALSSYSLSLTNRQKRVLSLIVELGAAGPSLIASEIDISLSTAYRDLMCLEERGLLKSDETGKRSLTSEGVKYLDVIFSP